MIQASQIHPRSAADKQVETSEEKMILARDQAPALTLAQT